MINTLIPAAMSKNDDVIPDSTYAPLLPPAEFKSEIPEYLLADASPQEKHIMAALSVGTQYHRWLVNALVETHSQVRRTNGRLLRAEDNIKNLGQDSQSVKVGWRVIVKATAIIGGIIGALAAVYKVLSHT